MKCVGLLEIISVQPSGSAAIAALTPIEVPPPGRLSITTDCPSLADMCGAIRRATTSFGEPGVNGAMILIGRSGKFSAQAAAETARESEKESANTPGEKMPPQASAARPLRKGF